MDDEIPPDALIPAFPKKRGKRFVDTTRRPHGYRNTRPQTRPVRVSDKSKVPSFPHWKEQAKEYASTQRAKKGRGDVIVEKHKPYNAFSQRALRVEHLDYATGEQLEHPLALPRRPYEPKAISADISHLQDRHRPRDEAIERRSIQRRWQAEVPAAVAGLIETAEGLEEVTEPALPVRRLVSRVGTTTSLPRASPRAGVVRGTASAAADFEGVRPEVRPKTQGSGDLGSTQAIRRRQPTGRRSVVMLQEYLDRELEREAEEANDPIDSARTRHALFGQVFQELARQSAIDCTERGQLFARVWLANADLFKQITSTAKKDRRKYLDALRSKQEELQGEAEELREQLSTELEGYKVDNERLVKENNEITRQFATLDEQVNIANGHKVKLEADFKRLRSFLTEEADRRTKVEAELEEARGQIADLKAEKVAMQQEFEHQISIAQRRAQQEKQRPQGAGRGGGIAVGGLAFPTAVTRRPRAASAWNDTREENVRPLWLDVATQTKESAVRDMKQQLENEALGLADRKALNDLAISGARERLDTDSSRRGRSDTGTTDTPFKKKKKDATEDFHTLLRSLEGGGNKGRLRSKKWVGKMIDQIYTEKMFHDHLDDKEGRNRTTLPEYTQEFYLNKYGVRHLANECLLDLLTSVAAYEAHPKMKLFKRLCARRSQDALNYFLYVLSYVERNCAIHSFGEEGLVDTTITYSHAEQAVLSILGQLDESAKNSTLVQAERMCDNNNQIQLDRFLSLILDEWDREMKRNTQRLKQLFHAGDINNDEVLSYDEFTELVQHVDDSISQRQVLSMFREALGQSPSHRDDITVDIFVKVMRRHGLGTMRADQELYTIDEDKMNESMKSLFESDWESMQRVITRNIAALEVNTSVPPDEILDIQNKLGKLQEGLADVDSVDHDPEEVWVLYRVLMATLNSTLLKYNAKNMTTRDT